MAIVSPIAGTTRDVMEVHLNLGGYHVIISDTAGLREHVIDPIEKEGIKRATDRIQSADFKLLVVDVQTLTKSQLFFIL